MQPFKLDIDKQPISTEALTIYHLKGKLSMETANLFTQKLRPEPAQHLILEMSGITFLDSAGVGSLVSLFVHRRSNGKTFALAALAPQSIAVVTVAGLQNLLTIFKTLDDAIARTP